MVPELRMQASEADLKFREVPDDDEFLSQAQIAN